MSKSYIKLFSCQYGSTLYGTNTPTSDLDLKHIVLPELNDILLGKKIKNEVHKTNNKKFTKNSVEDVDEEFIPVQVFASDFLGGQTYALELAYAVDSNHAGQILHENSFKTFTEELRTKFLTSNMTALVGYSVNQASLYSFKGERLNAVRDTYDFFTKLIDTFGENEKPENLVSIFERSARELEHDYPKYFQLTGYAIDNKGTMKPCIKLLEKTLPYTSTFGYSLKVISAQLKRYGSRADDASENNVDWKATSHALRIVEEGISLLSDHKLSFPFEKEYANFLLQIKRGEVPYDYVIKMINSRLDTLKLLEAKSALPAKTPELQENLESWMLPWLYKFYKLG